jgi:hypothetical protein
MSLANSFKGKVRENKPRKRYVVWSERNDLKGVWTGEMVKTSMPKDELIKKIKERTPEFLWNTIEIESID